MKNRKLMIIAIAMAMVWACAMVSMKALATSEISLFKDYQVAKVRLFEVPLNVGCSGLGRPVHSR